MHLFENKQTDIQFDNVLEGRKWTYADLAAMCINNTPPKPGETTTEQLVALKSIELINGIKADPEAKVELEDEHWRFVKGCVDGLPQWGFRHADIPAFRLYMDSVKPVEDAKK